MALVSENAKKMASSEPTRLGMPYGEETATEKFKRKAKESPFMIIGLSGCIFACTYGALLFRKHGKANPSLFLMQLRVTAQGTVIGCLMLGVTYNLAQRFVHRNDREGDD
uniref:Putative conserved plasma membrane protein n=1 Tax=Amblyomma aureolatum TaxID=187763 RepID=A0A1E1WYF1_9ACAR